MSDNMAKPLQIGDGATLHVGSDSYPCTIIAISSATKITIQRDRVTCTDWDRFYDRSAYVMLADTTGEILRAYLNKRGHWKISGKAHLAITVGERRAYIDPCT